MRNKLARAPDGTFILPRGGMFRLAQDFWSYEFDCKCGKCEKTYVSEELVQKLQRLRELTKYAIAITSGYRCSGHQESLRKLGYETAKGVSSHEKGLAVDIVCGAFDGKMLAELAEKAGFQNIGIGRRFIHVDVRPGGPRRWGYK
jgi:uncharacterized protein YcbK (DUF882 family)